MGTQGMSLPPPLLPLRDLTHSQILLEKGVGRQTLTEFSAMPSGQQDH